MESGTDGAIINREKARIRPEYPGPGAPIREKPVPVRGPLKGLLGKALVLIKQKACTEEYMVEPLIRLFADMKISFFKIICLVSVIFHQQ